MKRFCVPILFSAALSFWIGCGLLAPGLAGAEEVPEVESGLDAGQKAYEAGDYRTAFKKWTPLAEAGNAEAQYQIAQMFYEGKGVEPNYVAAFGWWKEAAEQGHVDAQFNFAMAHAFGHGTPRKPSKAVKWFEIAAGKGHKSAQRNLGIMLLNGKGTAKDTVQALKWLLLSIEPNEPDAKQFIHNLFQEQSLTDQEKIEDLVRTWRPMLKVQ